ncbi:hypothetical protein QBC35DRAFT_454141 [Podospora australis]|uniref:Uncharacterized protein n=1 Tax=Podospora australis TaxID=1536484 RepID=A0AAN6WNS3_9PEZI|nr:hypothetical protein QBC35DRAFT_454141 [Podospora australis]
MAALSRFAVNTCVLRVLGEQSQNKRLLYNLCLVNKEFHYNITPSLYRIIDSHVELIDAVNNPHLFWTRELRLHFHRSSPKISTPSMVQLLSRMPDLETFQWSRRPLEACIVRLLQKDFPKLRHLLISFPRDMEFGIMMALESDGRYCPEAVALYAQDFSSFKNLTSLTIKGIYGDLRSSLQQLTQVLCQCSHTLQSLELSVSADAVWWHREPGFINYGQDDPFLESLENLCASYARAGGQPLQLETLKLGPLLLPYEEAELTPLVSLRRLEEVALDNMPAYTTEGEPVREWGDGGKRGAAFEAFRPENCPNLRRFTVALFAKDVREFLFCHIAANQEANRTNPLALSFQFIEDRGLLDWHANAASLLRSNPKYPGVPPVKLRMMELILDYFMDEEPIWEDEEWPPPEPRLQEILPPQKVAAACQGLRYLKYGGDCWRVTRHEGEEAELERLTPDQWEGVELFSFSTFDEFYG